MVSVEGSRSPARVMKRSGKEQSGVVAECNHECGISFITNAGLRRSVDNQPYDIDNPSGVLNKKRIYLTYFTFVLSESMMTVGVSVSLHVLLELTALRKQELVLVVTLTSVLLNSTSTMALVKSVVDIIRIEIRMMKGIFFYLKLDYDFSFEVLTSTVRNEVSLLTFYTKSCQTYVFHQKDLYSSHLISHFN